MKQLIFITSFVAVLTASPVLGLSSNDVKPEKKPSVSGKAIGAENSACALTGPDLKAAQAYIRFKGIKDSHIPSGTPEIYGKELDISFDEVQDAINKVRVFGPTYGKADQKIQLAGADLQRYIEIGTSISCEFCCRAKEIVRKDGVAACGCAHSIMMRGLMAYLIKNHPDLSNERILEELNIWKTAYFPKQTLTAKLQTMEKSGDEGIKEILKEFPEFLPKMVGGC
jgi:hypothetical protein